MTTDQKDLVPTNNVNQVIQLAITQGADIDRLEKLLELQERYEANEAKKAYHKAMASFKANPPSIFKDRHVRFQTAKGVTEYDHATLANVCRTINSELSKYGLSASWKTFQDEQLVSVTCCITHELGHQERTTLSAGRDESGGKNAIQALGSTVSYLERYTLLSITGLATDDMDNDGGDIRETITPEQVANIEALMQEVGADLNRFLEYYKIEDLADIPAEKYERVIKDIERKRQ